MLPQMMPLPWVLLFFVMLCSMSLVFLYFNYVTFSLLSQSNCKLVSRSSGLPW